MSLSGDITAIILDMLDAEGSAELQRNELAQSLGCVPSQINYVLASRFTPEQGYLVESRRGGGGYIRVTRVKLDRGALLMHVVNGVGPEIDERSCHAHLANLECQGLLEPALAAVMRGATTESCLRALPPGTRDKTRAALLKQMLLVLTTL